MLSAIAGQDGSRGQGHRVTGLTAFVLGGGGMLGAAEAGMLQALAAHGIEPDLVVGTSVGAINGAAYACEAGPTSAARLAAMWAALI